MIIRKVQLEPFGRFPRQVCKFKPGLNVILGPNDPGKTTLVNAIHAALFIPPSVRRNSQDWKNIVSQYLPHPHGDTARVILELDSATGSSPLRLCCAWGAEREARLVLDEGVEISDEISINRKLEELLRHGRGTYEGVLIARQAELINTLDRIKQDQEALSTLADMLRAVVFQSGGISVDELENRLQQNIEELVNNWEIENDAPRGGRDIDNPHRRSVGRILKQYYQMRTLQQKLRGALKAEKTFEDAIQKLQGVEADYREIENKEKEMKKIEGDVNRRNALEPQLKFYDLRQEQLKKTARDWPKKEERNKYLAERKEELEKEKKRLAIELAQSQKEQETKKKRDIYRKSRQLKEELDGKKEELGKLPPITQGKMQRLEEKEKELSRLKAEIGGMKLKIKLITEKAVEVKVKSGLKEEKVLRIEDERFFEAQGRFNLEAPGWRIDVQSGVKDVGALLKKVEELESEIERELQGLGLSEVKEAREIRREVGELEGKIHILGERLQDALKGHYFKTLKKELEEAGEEKAVRDTVVINEDITEKGFELKSLAKEMDELKELLRNWQAEHIDHDSLLEAIVELRSKSKAAKEELDRLAPLPEEYDSAEDFLEVLKGLREKKEDLWEKLLTCRENKIRAENDMPEESPEEIEKALNDTQKRLQDLKDEAVALLAVKIEFYKLKEELDVGTFFPLQKLFLEYLSPLTGYRYRHARMREALPEGIAIEDGAEPLPLELLSHGTISGVALALRLAMAGYLFRENEGFIVMDDPLVDLDPERKKQAAKVLQKAAEDKQIIITTFEPHTAKLLGGNIVEI